MTQISMIPTFDCLRQAELDALRIARTDDPKVNVTFTLDPTGEINPDSIRPVAAKPSRRPRRQPVNVADSTPF